MSGSLEDIPLVPLYYSALRPTVERDGTLIMVDDDRFRFEPGEEPVGKMIRFRTLGCYPLSGAVESTATTHVSSPASQPRCSPLSTRAHVPSADQRRCRLYTVFQQP